MKELGIVLDFKIKSKTITIDEITLPMRNINLLQGSSILRALKLNNSLAKEPLSTLDATKRVTHILDAKYAKADLQSIVKNNCKHLSANHQKKLLQLLIKLKSLFGGTLGDWKTKPVSFQLKEGISPYHGRAFPVPKIHKDVLIKEVERLCKLGVLERQHYSEWASPSFIVGKIGKIYIYGGLRRSNITPYILIFLYHNFFYFNGRLYRRASLCITYLYIFNNFTCQISH
jgi:hypothetical protein